jgi:uncharacterized protein (DUF2235 family)
MSKNIVVCLDGTWNGPDQKDPTSAATPTNVQKIFEGLSGSAALSPTDNEKEASFADAQGAVVQVAKYIHGVGDTSNVLAQKAQGAFGLGLIARIVRGYTYLSRQYRPGDHIYILGFSRGAYTARALAGFVAGKGLLDWTAMKLVAESATSYSAGVTAWQQYKQSLHCDNPGLLHMLAECVTDISDRLAMGMGPVPALQFVSNIPICAVGVWETVGALGIPNIYAADNTLIRKDEFEFADTGLSPAVSNGFHAVAVDEQRVDFTPTLWDTRDSVVQVLFPGAHADVGGGYPSTQSGLSNCALAWMAKRLSAAGVLFANFVAGEPNPSDIAHQPWIGAPYETAPREFPPTLELSQRVLQRLAGGPVPIEKGIAQVYRPQNLLNSYIKYDWSGPAAHTQVDT